MTQPHARAADRTQWTCLLDGGATLDPPSAVGQLSVQLAEPWGLRCLAFAGALYPSPGLAQRDNR